MGLSKNGDITQTSFCGYVLGCSYSKQNKKIDVLKKFYLYVLFKIGFLRFCIYFGVDTYN